MSEWRQVMKHDVALMPRSGWLGAWDAVVAAITGRPVKMVNTDVVFSVWVKTDNDVDIRLFGSQIETSQNHE